MVVRNTDSRGSVFSSVLVFGAAGILAMALVFSGTHAGSGRSAGVQPVVQQYSQLGATTDNGVPQDTPTPSPTPQCAPPKGHDKHKGDHCATPPPSPSSGGDGGGGD
jgi:hypothetical protein